MAVVVGVTINVEVGVTMGVAVGVTPAELLGEGVFLSIVITFSYISMNQKRGTFPPLKNRIDLRAQTLNTLLQSLEVTPVMAVLRQAPRHDAAQALGLDNLLELAGNQLRRVPSPVHALGRVPVPLPTLLGVLLPVGDGVDEVAALDPVGHLEGDGAGEARVGAVGELEDGRLAAGRGGALDAGLGGEPLGVEGEAEDELAGVHAALDVGVDGLGGALDAGVVGGDVVTAVHEIVCHDLVR